MSLPYSKTETMQDAAVATGNGTSIVVSDMASLGMQITGTFVGTVTFEATVDGTNWVVLECMNVATGAKVTAVSGTSAVNIVVVAPVAGLSQVRARVSAWTSGSITVVGFGTASAAGLSLADVDVSSALPIVTPVTGTDAPFATSYAPGVAFWLESITCHLSSAPTSAGDFTITLNAADGTAYDTLLDSVDPSVAGVADLLYRPDDGPLLCEIGDAIDIGYTNPDGRTYGVRIVTRLA